jgi:enoyl-[acyl-carrier protein] reductase II
MLRNRFAQAVFEAERDRLDPERFDILLRSSSLKRAALEGDVEWGKVEVGQAAGLVHEILPAGELMHRLVAEMEAAVRRLCPIDGR